MMKAPVLEICAGDIDSVKAADEGGADRIELCSALTEGGVTPSAGLIRESRKVSDRLHINVLIRPHGGDFVYSHEEVDCMVEDVRFATANGADGVVIGALLPNGTIDTETCRRLIEAAGGKSVTFHRAFDMCCDPMAALETIIGLGCDRVLTSGQQANAEAGIDLLRQLVEQAGDRLSIMPGGGVSPDNAAKIMRLTGCRELHASARSTVRSIMDFRNPDVSMGAAGSDEYARKITDKNIVAQIVAAMSSIQ